MASECKISTAILRFPVAQIQITYRVLKLIKVHMQSKQDNLVEQGEEGMGKADLKEGRVKCRMEPQQRPGRVEKGLF